MKRARKYAKFIVASIGGAVTFGLQVVPPNTTTWQVLTGVALILTALGVRQVPNGDGT